MNTGTTICGHGTPTDSPCEWCHAEKMAEKKSAELLEAEGEVDRLRKYIVWIRDLTIMWQRGTEKSKLQRIHGLAVAALGPKQDDGEEEEL